MENCSLFLEKIIPKTGWFHRRRISKVQASRRSRWNPNLRSHPSYPQIKHPMWGPKMNQSTPPKKRLLGVDIGIDGVFCRTNLNIEISQQYPKSAPTFTPHLISWMEDPLVTCSHWPSPAGPISNCGAENGWKRPLQPAESLESRDFVGRCQDWEIPSGEFLVVARWNPFFCWWFMWFTMFAGENHVC